MQKIPLTRPESAGVGRKSTPRKANNHFPIKSLHLRSKFQLQWLLITFDKIKHKFGCLKLDGNRRLSGNSLLILFKSCLYAHLLVGYLIEHCFI
ncbi:hypothetical protein ERO13_D11G069766v2 [Gossypium hirsutum]|uniref:Uncharacterized protein n=3 Tax=Gossypium TaxID=3633 RepID=A0A5J5PC24_GOSBA|nr:hypothetical protein ES319_D11G073100v1 [Gossypium barbadense]KAG4119290.1 hypothetical protein ERO13_D11G069766v2 [Gossypium hirsutum]TYG44156.1 hypothetical protein ES288_D11G075800v1 [Gossypium darwinii]TYH42613.1 hypothetical protein ES332_D11G075200v1 [Gossypium tomentosum]